MATSQPLFHSDRIRLAIQVPRLPRKTYIPILITVAWVVPAASGGLTQEILPSSRLIGSFEARVPGLGNTKFSMPPEIQCAYPKGRSCLACAKILRYWP